MSEIKTLESYLSGAWVAGEGEGSPLYNPTTGEVIARASAARWVLTPGVTT